MMTTLTNHEVTIQINGIDCDALSVYVAKNLDQHLASRSSNKRQSETQAEIDWERDIRYADDRRNKILRELKRVVSTCDSHDAALAKSTTVNILGRVPDLQLEVVEKSRWNGEPREQRVIRSERYATLKAAQTEAESLCTSRFGDAWTSY